MLESLDTNLSLFNGASSGAIRLISKASLGQYSKQAFWKRVSNPVTRRDMTATAAATALSITQGEFIGVKRNRKWGPVDNALGALKVIGENEGAFAVKMGREYQEDKLNDQITAALLAVEAAIEHVGADLTYSGNLQSTTTLTHGHLASGLQKMGDAASKVVCWVMHSKPYYDLVKQAITDKITNIADAVIYGGTPASLGRPVLVTDNSALLDANGTGTDTYNVLGLVSDAVTVVDPYADTVFAQLISGNEQLVMRSQFEFDYTVEVKGFAWDTGNGGANPTDAAVATTTNWDKVAASYKDCAGVRIIVT